LATESAGIVAVSPNNKCRTQGGKGTKGNQVQKHAGRGRHRNRVGQVIQSHAPLASHINVTSHHLTIWSQAKKRELRVNDKVTRGKRSGWPITRSMAQRDLAPMSQIRSTEGGGKERGGNQRRDKPKKRKGPRATPPWEQENQGFEPWYSVHTLRRRSSNKALEHCEGWTVKKRYPPSSFLLHTPGYIRCKKGRRNKPTYSQRGRVNNKRGGGSGGCTPKHLFMSRRTQSYTKIEHASTEVKAEDQICILKKELTVIER